MSTGGPDDEQQGPTPENPFDDDAIGPTRVRDALAGLQVGEYLLESRLGEGAMGIVYRGRHPLLGRAAAVKVLKQEFADAGDKLLAEARAVAQARHPNIIDIFGFGTTPSGQPYFVMELLEGEPLDLWLRSRAQLTPAEVVGILKQLLSGLAAAHAAGVIHRDLKPGNLFMARLADGTHFLKILDFGLARNIEGQSPGATGLVAGTPLYMAPEQVIGAPATPQSDLYAVGCLAFELLTGAPPFQSESMYEVMQHQRETPPPPLPATLPQPLRELVSALLEKDPAQRPPSATDARASLERVERKLLVTSATGPLPKVPEAPPAAAPPTAGPRPASPRPVRASGSAQRQAAAEPKPTVRLPEAPDEPAPAPPPKARKLSLQEEPTAPSARALAAKVVVAPSSATSGKVAASSERPTVLLGSTPRAVASNPNIARPTLILPEEVPGPAPQPAEPPRSTRVDAPSVERRWLVAGAVVALLALLALAWIVRGAVLREEAEASQPDDRGPRPVDQ